MLSCLCLMHCQVHQHSSLYPNCFERKKLLLCCQRRIRTRLVQSSQIRHRWWYRYRHHVFGKNDDRLTHCLPLLPFRHLRQLSQQKLCRTSLVSCCKCYSIQLVFIIAWLIATLFMSVYAVAMDALLQCFIVDEMNQKGKGKAKWAPADLADLMDNEE